MTAEDRSLPLSAGVAILVTLTALAALAPWLVAHDPRALTGESFESPSTGHLLGTNAIGQDVFSQLVWGARVSLGVALPAAALAMFLAIVVGMATGLRGGWADVVAMRGVDMFLAVPGLPLMLLVGALLRPGTVEIALIIGFVGWPAAARLLRAQVLSLRHRGFVLAARGFGGSTRYLVRRHLFPAVSPVVSAGFLQWAATAVLLEAGLAFLGVGDPTATSWGRMLEQGVTHQGMYTDWQWVWLLAPPGLAITLTVAGFALVGLGLEPILDPRLRRLA